MRLKLNPSSLFYYLSLTLLCPALLLPAVTAAEAIDATPTLKQQLDTATAGFTERAPPDVIQNIQDAIHEVEGSGILDKVLKTGDRAPDFELPDATGKTVRLSDLLKDGPVILVWYRGNW